MKERAALPGYFREIGLAGNGQIFYSTNLATWTNIPGALSLSLIHIFTVT